MVGETNFGAIDLLLLGEVPEFVHRRGFHHPTAEYLKKQDPQLHALPFWCVRFVQEIVCCTQIVARIFISVGMLVGLGEKVGTRLAGAIV